MCQKVTQHVLERINCLKHLETEIFFVSLMKKKKKRKYKLELSHNLFILVWFQWIKKCKKEYFLPFLLQLT